MMKKASPNQVPNNQGRRHAPGNRLPGCLALIFLACGLQAQAPVEHPDVSSQVHALLAQSVDKVNRGEFEAALALVQEALRLQPDYDELYRLEGHILEILERFGEALTAWENCARSTASEKIRTEAQVHILNLQKIQ